MKLHGVVRHWNHHRGYGKIFSGVDRRTYFCHRDELTDYLSLVPGQVVVFTPDESARGPRARDVYVINELWFRSWRRGFPPGVPSTRRHRADAGPRYGRSLGIGRGGAGLSRPIEIVASL